MAVPVANQMPCEHIMEHIDLISDSSCDGRLVAMAMGWAVQMYSNRGFMRTLQRFDLLATAVSITDYAHTHTHG